MPKTFLPIKSEHGCRGKGSIRHGTSNSNAGTCVLIGASWSLSFPNCKVRLTPLTWWCACSEDNVKTRCVKGSAQGRPQDVPEKAC